MNSDGTIEGSLFITDSEMIKKIKIGTQKLNVSISGQIFKVIGSDVKKRKVEMAEKNQDKIKSVLLDKLRLFDDRADFGIYTAISDDTLIEYSTNEAVKFLVDDNPIWVPLSLMCCNTKGNIFLETWKYEEVF
jgi:hypothetical protein